MPAISAYTKLLEALETLEAWQEELGITTADAITALLAGKQPIDADLTTLATPTAWRVFYSDASQVIQQLALGAAGTVLQSSGASSAPSFASITSFSAGMMMDYAGDTAPSLWLLCYGQAISRTTYSVLFGVIGTTYGAGDASTTFNLPDVRGRVVAGQDDMGGVSANRLTGVTGSVDGDVLGGTGGEETHTLSIAEMPAHTHPSPFTLAGGGSGTPVVASSTTDTNTDVTGSTGGGGAHNIVQPTIILNKIIYAGI